MPHWHVTQDFASKHHIQLNSCVGLNYFEERKKELNALLRVLMQTAIFYFRVFYFVSNMQNFSKLKNVMNNEGKICWVISLSLRQQLQSFAAIHL